MTKVFKVGQSAFYNGKVRDERMPKEWLDGWDFAFNAYKDHPDLTLD